MDFEIEPRAATLLRLDLSINEQHFTRTASARAQLVNVAEGIRLDSAHTRDEKAEVTPRRRSKTPPVARLHEQFLSCVEILRKRES